MNKNPWMMQEVLGSELLSPTSANKDLMYYHEHGVVESCKVFIATLFDPSKVFYTTLFGDLNNADKIDDAIAEKGTEEYTGVLFRMFVRSDPVFDGVFKKISDVEAQYLQKHLLPAIEGTALYYLIKSILTFREDVRQYNNYEEALHFLKRKHNHELIPYTPEDDGVTHINVYSKGKTELGRLLSNFAHTPFEHYEHGHFSSIEAYWYWLSTGMKFDELRSLFGFNAKKVGLALRKATDEGSFVEIKNFNALIKQAILIKIETTPNLRELLHYSSLPLTHYYVWGSGSDYKITYPIQYNFLYEYMEIVRKWLNGEAHKVLIAGSRGIKDYEFIKKAHLESGIIAVEFLSGMAKGVDQDCVTLAGELEMPLRKFPADWEKHGKSAGYVRNREMANYCTYAEIHWDGVSNGTKNMIELLAEEKIHYNVYRHGNFDIPPGR